MDAPEDAAAVVFGGPAPAGADRIDQHQIGEGEPGVRIVRQTDLRAVVTVAEDCDARADKAEIEERRARSRAAVEHEGYRPRRVVRFGHEGRVKDSGGAVAGLIEQREGAGCRRVAELAGRRVDCVLGDGIGRQQREHARSVLAADIRIGHGLFRPAPLAVARALAPRPVSVFLRERRNREHSNKDSGNGAAKGNHRW